MLWSTEISTGCYPESGNKCVCTDPSDVFILHRRWTLRVRVLPDMLVTYPDRIKNLFGETGI